MGSLPETETNSKSHLKMDARRCLAGANLNCFQGGVPGGYTARSEKRSSKN